MNDPRVDAAAYLLANTYLAKKAVDPPYTNFKGVEKEYGGSFSHSEYHLFHAAWSLTSRGATVDLGGLLDRLDNSNFERFITSLRIARGQVTLADVTNPT